MPRRPRSRLVDLLLRYLPGGNTWTDHGIVGAAGGGASRPYGSTDATRLVAGRIPGPSGTANAMLAQNLSQLARQLRHLERNNATVRSIVEGHKAEIIGTGISVKPNTGDAALDADLALAWREAARHLGLNGESSMELQRMWLSEIDCAGNALGRIVADTDRMDAGLLPIAVVPLEAEWLATIPVETIPKGHGYYHGVETDILGRVLRYHIRDPDTGAEEIVPRGLIIHGFERKRPRQVIGEPRLCAVIERGLQSGTLVDVELQAAINANAWISYLKQEAGSNGSGLPTLDGTEDYDSDGDEVPITEVAPGTHVNLASGEDMGFFQPTRPSQKVSEFYKSLSGDLAAAGHISRVWLDRDGSQYNFANSKFDQIRSNMLTKPFQQWFGPATIGRMYEISVPYLLLSLGRSWPADPRLQRMMLRHELQPDIPPETDEKSAAQALESLLKSGGTTLDQWHSERGRDWRVVMQQRAEEIATARELGITSAAPTATATPIEDSTDA